MKNNLKLSHYNPSYHSDYPDTICNDSSGKLITYSPTFYSRSISFLSDSKSSSICTGCHYPIYDQYLLKVSPDLEWHSHCLKCSECDLQLDESTTCFVLDGKTFCKSDYIR